MAYDPDLRVRHGARLPHWTKGGAIYAVTFRLADSLPQEKLEGLLDERERLMRKSQQRGTMLSERDAQYAYELFSKRISQYLDAGYGACWLKHDDIAEIVDSALKHFNGERYELFTWCIMPNHVHVVLQPLTHTLSEILHSWKSFTAQKANKLLGRSGPFWQVEYFDHLIRNREDWERCVEYTYSNPELAGLKNWRWRWRQ